VKLPENDTPTTTTTVTEPWIDHLNEFKSDQLLNLHRGAVYSVSLSADTNTLMTGSQNSQLCVYDLIEKKQLRSSTVGEIALTASCVLDDTHLLVGSSDDTIYVYNTAFGSVTCELQAHDDPVTDLKLCSDKQRFVSCSWDGTVKLWTLTDNNSAIDSYPLIVWDHDGAYFQAVDVFGDHIVACGDDGLVAMHDIKEEEIVWEAEIHTDNVRAVCFTPDGQSVLSVCVDGMLIQSSTLDGSLIMSIDTKEALNAVVTDGISVLAGGPGGRLRRWDLATQQEASTSVSVRCHGVTHILWGRHEKKEKLVVISDAPRDGVEIFTLEH
jgi:WD40 repeat protein